MAHRYLIEDEIGGYEEHLRDGDPFGFGDPRRCPRHPHVVTSDPYGLCDAPCSTCEGEMEDAANQREWDALPAEERARIEAEIAAWEAQRAIIQAGSDEVGF